MIELKVFYWFLKAIFCGLFQVGNKQWRIAGKELISKPTFRLPDSAHSDYFIGLRVFKRSLSNLSQTEKVPQSRISVLVYDGSVKSFNKRKSYLIWVKKYNKEQIFGLGRDNVYLYAKKNNCFVLLIVLSIIVIPFTIVSKNRVKWALVLFEFIETCGLISFINKTRLEKVHFFSPAEKDSNLAYLLIHKFGVTVTKHPSPGALVAHNRNLMTDTLALSSLYQNEEYNLYLKDSIETNSIENWPPENAQEYEQLYYSKEIISNTEFKYGFYSHGGWLRKDKGLTDGLYAKPEEEENCLKIISEFINNDTNEEILIYLHPKEKENLASARDYYSNFFNEGNYKLYTDSLSSAHTFNNVEIGIGAYSTVLFERQNLGFKTLIWKDVVKDFPKTGTTFYKNSFSSLIELENIISNYK